MAARPIFKKSLSLGSQRHKERKRENLDQHISLMQAKFQSHISENYREKREGGKIPK